MKKILFMFVVCLSTMFMTSCEEVVKSTYYMSSGDMSTNFANNGSLQNLVYQEIKDDNNTLITFFGEEEDAIVWFDSICEKVTDPSYTADIPVSENTWMDLNLKDIDYNVVKTTRLTFSE